MKGRWALALGVTLAISASWVTWASQAPPEPTRLTGKLADGTAYNLVKPANWNGTVFVDLDSVGLDADYSKWLYARGIARAGTSRNITQWHIDKAVDNQAEVLSVFTEKVGRPTRSIIWDNSLGALVAAGVAQKYPDRFVAALPQCGALAGSISFWNTRLDTAFTLNTLLAPEAPLPIVNVPADFRAASDQWVKLVERAQATPQGRARIALAAAIGQVPVWTTRELPEPADDAAEAREEASYRTLHDGLLAQMMSSGRQYEEASGGVAAWNTGVSYAALFEKSARVDRATVTELYRKAGLDLRGDLRTLDAAPRIAADPAAVERAKKNVVFDGKLRIPVLALNITGDSLAWSVYDTAYERIVKQEGRSDLLRLTYVHGPGHCGFNGAERIAAFQTMLERLDSGRWPDTSARALNARGAMTRFVDYRPPTLNRTFFAADKPETRN